MCLLFYSFPGTLLCPRVGSEGQSSLLSQWHFTLRSDRFSSLALRSKSAYWPNSVGMAVVLVLRSRGSVLQE